LDEKIKVHALLPWSLPAAKPGADDPGYTQLSFTRTSGLGAAVAAGEFSTRPAVSTNFCSPVKNGWQAAQMPILMSRLVERV